MRIYQAENYQAMSRRAANIISAQVIYKPNCVLGLATGGTPVGAYNQLVEWYEKGDLSFGEVRTVNLDEYFGLSPHHEQSYRYFMDTHLFNHIDIRPENTWVPDGLTEDAAAECAQYDERIRSLGYADLQLLGVGRNGHIGFNEPGEDFMKATHVVDLAESTIDANARFFASRDEVPRQAFTIGADKADAIYNAVCGPITPRCPGSILQLHDDVVLVGDEAALGRLIQAGICVCG